MSRQWCQNYLEKKQTRGKIRTLICLEGKFICGTEATNLSRKIRNVTDLPCDLTCLTACGTRLRVLLIEIQRFRRRIELVSYRFRVKIECRPLCNITHKFCKFGSRRLNMMTTASSDHLYGLFLLPFLYNVCMFFNFCFTIAIKL